MVGTMVGETAAYWVARMAVLKVTQLAAELAVRWVGALVGWKDWW